MSYNWELKKARVNVWQKDNEVTVDVDALHMIPKYIGLYVGESFTGYIRDPSICISGEGQECWTDDFNDLRINRTSTITETGTIYYDDTENP